MKTYDWRDVRVTWANLDLSDAADLPRKGRLELAVEWPPRPVRGYRLSSLSYGIK